MFLIISSLIKTMRLERALEIGEHIDRLISTDLHTRRFIIDLYEAARRRQDQRSLTFKAAYDINQKVKENDAVLMLVGFPTYDNFIAEQDGPVGGAILGRSIVELKNAKIIVLTDKAQKPLTEESFKSAGFSIVSNPKDIHNRAQATVIGIEEGKDLDAEDILDELNPSAIITIERPGRNKDGKYMSMKGLDLSYKIARLDKIVDIARERRILTIGVGDGGNEIGCGIIWDDVRKLRPNGELIATIVKTDDLVFAFASNVGAYGIAGMLSALNEDLYILPTKETLYFTLLNSARAGLHNGPPLWLDPGTDGIPYDIEMYILEIIRRMVWEELNPHFPKFY